MITISKTLFGDPDHIVTAEWKLKAFNQINCDFSSYFAELQYYTANATWNNPTKCTALLWNLNNEIKKALFQYDNVHQQFWEFVAFLHWLDNQIRTQEVEKKGRPVLCNPNNTPWAPPAT
jgi:hypothetical protein